jgi:DNA-binding NarL/FixJ family response regulator
VVLAEPRRLIGQAYTEALRTSYGIDVHVADGDPSSTLRHAQLFAAEVVLVTDPTRSDLAELCAALDSNEPPARVLVIDWEGSEDNLLRAVECGAAGFLSGDGGLDSLVEAIHALLRGESVVPPVMLGHLLRRLIERRREAGEVADRLVTLTPREREVLALIVEGRDAAGIASHLFISTATARTHVQRVLRKVGVHSRLEAMALMSRTGLVDRLERLIERSLP